MIKQLIKQLKEQGLAARTWEYLESLEGSLLKYWWEATLIW